ncbi:VOC family protein [Desertimonas flava]|uniref:VOC family protein n=1 Tax=Desertimonas flava TaxID=2064846 RepID=UPI000E353FAA|nr:VOC family protein [Desertimonas flava]
MSDTGTLNLHHVALVSENLPGLTEFYVNVLGLEQMTGPRDRSGVSVFNPIEGYSRPTAAGATGVPADFLAAGRGEDLQLHLCLRNPYIGGAGGMVANPVGKGHVAFRCEDIEAFKARLRRHHIPFADCGEWAVRGWYQIFFYDPAGTVVEVHQVMDGGA